MNNINNQNYYQTLGIEKNATEKEIKDSYLKLAKIWRPREIKEREGREPNQVEKQKWHEILDDYHEALKESDKLKEQKTNENNANLSDFSEKSVESNKEQAGKGSEERLLTEVYKDAHQGTAEILGRNANPNIENLSASVPEWKEKKIWEVSQVLSNIHSWNFLKIFRYNLYQKKDEFFTELDYRKCPREDLIFYNYINSKVEEIDDIFELNEKTKQLGRELLPPSECNHRHSYFFQQDSRPFIKALGHIKCCLKTEQEIDESIQKIIRTYKRAWKEFERALLEEKGIVWECEEPQFDDFSLNSYVQESYLMYRSTDKIPPQCCDGKGVCTGNIPGGIYDKQYKLFEKRLREWLEQKKLNVKKMKNQPAEKIVSNQTNQNHANTDETTLIIQLKAEITELKKNLSLSDEQKVILSQKEAKLAKLEGKQGENQGFNSSNSKKEANSQNNNKLISVGLPIAIISVLLLIISTLCVIRRKGLKKNKKIEYKQHDKCPSMTKQ